MTRNRMRNRLVCLTLLAVLLAVPALRAAPRLYDVEVIIFSNTSAESGGEPVNRPDEHIPWERGRASSNEFTALSSDAYRLNNIQGALARSRGYHVLYHRAWRQPAEDRAHAVGYPVHTPAYGGGDSVEGAITLLKERYLHLDVDLVLRESAVTAPGSYVDGPVSTPVFRLSEKRRIRSGELHYFDHPRFGVIASVTPYEIPEAQPNPAAGEQGTPAEPGEGQEAEPEPAPKPAPADDQLTR